MMPAAKDGMIDKSVRPSIVNGGKNVTRQSLWSANRISSLVKNWWCINVWRIYSALSTTFFRGRCMTYMCSMYSEVW